MKKLLLLFSVLFLGTQAFSQILFSEDFDGISGPTAGGAGTYTFPPGWLLRNVDNLTPTTNVNYVNEAWERREDFQNNVADSVAFSTSWTSPAGIANDWMWTPLINITPNAVLKWNAKAYDPLYPDGYEVRIMVAPTTPTGGAGVIGNQITNSTQVFSIAAENSSWTARQVSLSTYTGQSIYIGFRNISNDKFLLVIDDVVVEVQTNNDLRLNNGTVGHGEYTAAPSDQLTTIQNIQLKGTIQNMGVLAATNARLACDVMLNGSFLTTVESAITPSLAANATEAKTIDYFPTTDGTYTYKFYPKMTEVDEMTSNDTIYDSNSLEVIPSMMRRDDGTVVGSLGIGAGTIAYLGQTFNIETPVYVESISAYFTRGYVGRDLRAAIYNTDISGVPTTLLVATDTLQYIDDSARVYTMPINGGSYLLAPGKYAVLQIEIDSTLALGNTSTIFKTNTVFVQWAANGPNFSPVENFGPAFAKPLTLWPNFDQCFGETGGTLASQTLASCGGSNGTATVSLDAGYSITWEDATTNATCINLPVGYATYTMTNGTCTFTDSVLIENPNAPTMNIDNIVDALCNGQTGEINITISGGTAPYSILWSDNSSNEDLVASAGTYTAVITDAANCVVNVTSSTITEPSVLGVTINSTDETCVACNDGTAAVVVSGGTPNYTYSWSNGATTDSIGGLAPGTYDVTVTDANGCSVNLNSTVNMFVGLDELANFGLEVYPNPVVDFITVSSKKDMIVSTKVIDAAGKTIAIGSVNNFESVIDFRKLAKGAYTIEIQTAKTLIRTAVIK